MQNKQTPHFIPDPAYLKILVGHSPEQQLYRLQEIKDAIVYAMLKEIESDGIQSDFRHFEPWENIYLEADHMAHQIREELPTVIQM